jgi:acetyl-CoA carboxylase biotin carboxylase subunit
VTGLDLVGEQIRVAAGARLSFTQDDVEWSGHAIECRVYAEDPENNFLPSPGRIDFLRVPAGPGIRDDGGVTEGDEVSIYYDPMISKLAAWGRTRTEAIDRMRRALDEYAVGGIKTTLPFFREVIRDEEFIAGHLDTGFIACFNERRHKTANVSERSGAAPVSQDIAIIAAALAFKRAQNKSFGAEVRQTDSKWRMTGRVSSMDNFARDRSGRF